MRITESKLRSIIRQVIAEGYRPGPSAFLDSWLRQMVDDCNELFPNARCKYFPYTTRRPNDGSCIRMIKKDGTAPAILKAIGDEVIICDGLSSSEVKKLISFMENNCNSLKSEKLCAGVFMNGQKIDLGEYEPY